MLVENYKHLNIYKKSWSCENIIVFSRNQLLDFKFLFISCGFVYSGAFSLIFSSKPEGSPFFAISRILAKYSLVASSHFASDI